MSITIHDSNGYSSPSLLYPFQSHTGLSFRFSASANITGWSVAANDSRINIVGPSSSGAYTPGQIVTVNFETTADFHDTQYATLFDEAQITITVTPTGESAAFAVVPQSPAWLYDGAIPPNWLGARLNTPSLFSPLLERIGFSQSRPFYPSASFLVQATGDFYTFGNDGIMQFLPEAPFVAQGSPPHPDFTQWPACYSGWTNTDGDYHHDTLTPKTPLFLGDAIGRAGIPNSGVTAADLDRNATGLSWWQWGSTGTRDPGEFPNTVASLKPTGTLTLSGWTMQDPFVPALDDWNVADTHFYGFTGLNGTYTLSTTPPSGLSFGSTVFYSAQVGSFKVSQSGGGGGSINPLDTSFPIYAVIWPCYFGTNWSLVGGLYVNHWPRPDYAPIPFVAFWGMQDQGAYPFFLFDPQYELQYGSTIDLTKLAGADNQTPHQMQGFLYGFINVGGVSTPPPVPADMFASIGTANFVPSGGPNIPDWARVVAALPITSSQSSYSSHSVSSISSHSLSSMSSASFSSMSASSRSS